MKNPAEDLRRKTMLQQAQCRHRAFGMLDAGASASFVARTLGVHVQTVMKWKRRRKALGEEEAVQGLQRGARRGAGAVIAPACEEALLRAMADAEPEDLGVSGGVWHTEVVRRLLAERFGVRAASSTVAAMLKRWGLTSRSIQSHQPGPDPQWMRRWVREELWVTLDFVKERNGVLLWFDELPLRRNPAWVENWRRRAGDSAPAWADAAVLMAALTPSGKLLFQIISKSPDAGVFCRFLGQLRKAYGRQLLVVMCDDAPHHAFDLVAPWMQRNGFGMRVRRLPTASFKEDPLAIRRRVLGYARRRWALWRPLSPDVLC